MSDEVRRHRDLLPIASRRDTARLAWRLLRRRTWPLASAAVAFVGAGLCGLVAPWVLGRLVDSVRDGDAATVAVQAAWAIGVAGVVGGACTAGAAWLLARAAEPALAEVREALFDEALALDSARLEEAGVGDLLSRVGDDVRAVGESLVEVVPLLVQSAVTIGLTAGGLLLLDWRLALAGFLTVPLYLASLRWYLPRSGPYYARERVALGERAQTLVGGIRASGTLRAFSRGGEQLGRVERASDEARTITLDVFRLLTRFFARNNGVEYVGLATILAVGFLLVRRDLATAGAVTAACLYFHRLFNPIGALLVLFDELQSAGAALARLAGLVVTRQRPDGVESSNHGAGKGNLRVQGVSHRYSDDSPPVLENIDLQLEPGTRTALVGRTGAGKTTLGALVAGVMPPSDGSVTYAGHDVRGPRLRDEVVLVSQEVHVFAGTVRENLDLARAGATDAELRSALELTGALAWVDRLPDRLDTVVGEHGHPLSPAQAQQLALTRVVLRDVPVVVLDEATAEAGSQGARELEAAALAVTRGRSSLVVAHRLTQAATADRVVVLDGGRVVEEGTHDELVARGGRYATLWRAWSEG